MLWLLVHFCFIKFFTIFVVQRVGKTEYCAYVMGGSWSRQWFILSDLIWLWQLHFVFIYIWTMIFGVGLCTLKLVGHVSRVSLVYLFGCWLWVTEMCWLGVGTVSCCQGLARFACVETVLLNTIWNGLLAVKGFPKYINVNTVVSLITVFTMSRICCVVTRLAVRCCCCLSYAILILLRSTTYFWIGGPTVGMTDT